MTDSERIYISGGHAYCAARQSDVAIEECFGCRWISEVNERSSPPYIVCDAKERAERGAADPLYMSWWYGHHRPPRAHPGGKAAPRT